MTFPPNEPWLKDWEIYYTTSRRVASNIDRLRKDIYKIKQQTGKDNATHNHGEALTGYVFEKENVLKNAENKLDLSAKYLKKAKDQEPEEIPNTYSPGHGSLNGGPSMMSLLSVAECLLKEVTEEVKGL